MHKIVILIFAVFFSIHVVADINKDFLTLVENGKVKTIIIISNHSAPCVNKASQELRRYLEKISGAKIQIVKTPDKPSEKFNNWLNNKNLILLGNNYLVRGEGIYPDRMTSESFVIKATKRKLIIAGKDGKRYWDNYRTCTDSAGTLYGVYHFLESLGVRWFYPLEVGTIIPRKKTIKVPYGEMTKNPYFHYRHIGYRNFTWARKIGAGGDRDIWSTRHTVSIKLKQYKELHPELFLKDANGERSVQADLNNPQVIEIMTDMAKKRFNSDIPEGTKNFLILPLDGKACWDASSEYVTSAVEKVAKKLKNEYPQYKVVHCPYNNFLEAPEKVRKLPENMALLLALKRSYLFSPDTERNYYRIIKGWQKFHPAAIYFCRYNGERLKMSPALIPHVISRDIKTFKKISETEGVPIQGEMNFVAITPNSEFAWWEFINEYIAAKMLWNPDLNVDNLLDDFCEKMFGPGAKEMREFLDICEKSYLDIEQRDFFKADTILKLEKLLDKARKKTESSEYATKVDFFNKGIEPLRCLRKKLASSEKLSPSSENKPICYYSFNKGIQKNEIKDETGEYKGLINNATPVNGISGKALFFTGNESYIKIIPPIQLKDTDYSLEAWIRPQKMEKGIQYIFGPAAWERQMLAIEYFYSTPEKGVIGKIILKHRRWEKNKNIELTSANYEFKPNDWYHIVGTFSKKNGMTIYVNGKIIGIDMYLTEPSDMPLFFIGASGQQGKNKPKVFDCFSGDIDELKVYNYELSYPCVKDKYDKMKKRL